MHHALMPLCHYALSITPFMPFTPFYFAEAELSLDRGDTESTMAYTRKALLLFEYIDKAYKTYTQVRIDKINILHQRLNPTP